MATTSVCPSVLAQLEEKAKVIAAAADYAYETYGYTPCLLPHRTLFDVSKRPASHPAGCTPPHYLFTEALLQLQTIGISRMKVVWSRCVSARADLCRQPGGASGGHRL